jgi:hypothetical protein
MTCQCETRVHLLVRRGRVSGGGTLRRRHAVACLHTVLHRLLHAHSSLHRLLHASLHAHATVHRLLHSHASLHTMHASRGCHAHAHAHAHTHTHAMTTMPMWPVKYAKIISHTHTHTCTHMHTHGMKSPCKKLLLLCMPLHDFFVQL